MHLLFERYRKFLKEVEGPFSTPNQLFIPQGCKDDACTMDKLKTTPTVENPNPDHMFNKPLGGFWTSTAWKLPYPNPKKLWTSNWNLWLMTDMPKWMSTHGILFKPRTSKVFHIAGDEDLKFLYSQFPRGRGIDWVEAFKEYDGIHYGKPNGAIGSRDPGMWDVESTCWRDASALGTPVGMVPLEQLESDDDDDDNDYQGFYGQIKEAAYEGNLGAEEIMKFYMNAPDEEIAQFEQFLAKEDDGSAWKLLQQTLGVQLVGMPEADIKVKIEEMSLRLDVLDDPFAQHLYDVLVSRDKEAVVYHGTSTTYFWDIVNNGFTFSEERKNFENTSPGTYFAFDQNRAGMYTTRSTQKAGGERIIFVAELPLARLSRDLDDAGAWDKTTKLQAMVADEIDPGDITGVIYPASSDGPEIPIKRFIEWANDGKISSVPPEDGEKERTFKGATQDDIEHAVVDYIQDLIQYTDFTSYNYGMEMARFNEKLLAALHANDYKKYKFWNGDVWINFLEKMLGEENEEDYYKQERRFQLPLYRVINKYIEEPKYFEKFRKAKGYNLNLADPSSVGTWDPE